MAGPYTIQLPVQGQPISSSLFGIPIRAAVNDLHTRVLNLEVNAQAMIARGQRTTAKNVAAGSAGTEWGYVRLDDIPVKANNAYRIMTASVNLDTDTANDVVASRCRVAYSATPGTAATTASTLLTQVRNTQVNASQSVMYPMSAFYFATADGFISLLVTGVRVSGAGALGYFASSTDIYDVTVEFAGPTPANTVVSL